MATIHPFRALRPTPDRAAAVASVPYDVISTAEARALAAGNPDSFLHVVRPEIDLPEGTDDHAPDVYEKGAENLQAYAESNRSVQDDAATLYVYRLVMDGRAQTGLFACVAVSEYDDNTILKHEKTRPDKEDDRTRHILTQRAHAEPVMLTYRDNADIDALIDAVQHGTPLYDFTAPDGVRHTIWKTPDPATLEAAFLAVDTLYVADGHHRCKAASRAWHDLVDSGLDDNMLEAAFFPAVLFPMGQMRILAYNRLVYTLPLASADFLNRLRQHTQVTENADPTPARPGTISLYLDGVWYGATLPPSRHTDAASQLDIARLGEYVLEPLLGITDPRTDKNLDFVGGIRGTDALKRRVDSGEAALAISMYPTSIEELVAVSDAGLLMPPKSTWFEPKLRSGLLVHVFD